jgi:glycosyltransferase involved in cell wall biosynthesis
MTTALLINPTGSRGGAEEVLLRLADALVADGWGVRALSPAGPMADELTHRGIVVERIPTLNLAPGTVVTAVARTLGSTVRAARRIRRVSRDVDVVVGNGVMALPALRLARPSPPTVWFLHDVIVRRVHRAIVRFGRQVADVIVAPSDATAAPVRALGTSVTVVRNGTPWPVEPATPGVGAPVIGCAATLTPLKGQDVLLDAVALLAETGAVLELAGAVAPKDGDYGARLVERAARPDLAGRVRFLGRVDDPLAVMRGWRVAVLASLRPEAAGLAVLEAMSVGVPVVATDHGGPSEVLDGAGLLVPPGNAAALADAIRRLLEDAGLWRRCAAAGPDRIAGGLSLAEQQRQLIALLRSAAGRRVTRSAAAAPPPGGARAPT